MSLVLEPKSTKEVLLYYIPKEIGKRESEVMIFESKEIGRWKFLAQGVGVPPTDFELV